jgi:hypothetical protein
VASAHRRRDSALVPALGAALLVLFPLPAGDGLTALRLLGDPPELRLALDGLRVVLLRIGVRHETDDNRVIAGPGPHGAALIVE